VETPDRPAIQPAHCHNCQLKDQLSASTRDRGGSGLSGSTVVEGGTASAVHRQGDPVDVPGLCAQQEDNGVRDVRRLSDAPEGETPEVLNPTASPSRMAFAAIPVFVVPGATALTVMNDGPSSTANTYTSTCSAAFVAA
jgi:hypothetical protein